MPSATVSKKTIVIGTKRKAESMNDIHVKKAKVIDVSKTTRKRTKQLAKPVELEDDSNEDDFDGFDSSDGGARLDKSDGLSSDSESEAQEKNSDGVHPDRVKAAANGAGLNGTSSREAHAKQKIAKKERTAAKPLAEQLARTKKLWEILRRKSHVPLEERKKLVEELFNIITGRIKDFVLKHDSVRVIQTAIKYSNVEQRRLIARELQGSYCQLAESKYAKFLIGKLLVQGDDEIRDLIVPEFFGHVNHMMKHPEASWILDDVYRGVATQQQKATILREWYGAEFALFRKDTGGKVTAVLSEILEEDSGKRAPIMRSLLGLINHLIQKKMTGFTLLHDAMLQYFLNAKQGSEEITDYLELIKGDEEGDLLKNLAFTRSGSRVVCLALAYGNAKDRKQILRTYKDTLQLMASDPYGHIIILTAYEVIDDTVLTSKSIYPELLSKDAVKATENVVFSANNLNARTTLLYLFNGRSSSLFPASLSTDVAILSEVDAIRPTTSKKDPLVRRAELAKALSPHLLAAIAAVPTELTSTSFGCQFVTDILLGAAGDKSAALTAIASTAAGNPSPLPTTQLQTLNSQTDINMHTAAAQVHIANAPFYGKMLKSLIAGGRFDAKLKKVVPVSPPLNFVEILYPIIEEHIVPWATGASSFVVLGLVEQETFSRKDDVLRVLRKNRAVLQRAATEETAEQRERARVEAEVEVEAAAVEGQLKGKGKGKKGKVKERVVGNMGARMLLALLD